MEKWLFKDKLKKAFLHFLPKKYNLVQCALKLKSHFSTPGIYPTRHYNTVDATSIDIVEPECKEYVQKSHSTRTNS